ncbi:MAG: hypothetical protein QM426_02750 [Euryarchaeota archaeon]|nr:hypothetical protein [Euryarchaeota archaeon]
MIKIIGKGYKYFLLQLDDFIEIRKTIVVSLKSVEGRNQHIVALRKYTEELPS